MCSYSGAYEIATDLVVRLAQSEVFCVVLCRLLYLFWSFLTPPPPPPHDGISNALIYECEYPFGVSASLYY